MRAYMSDQWARRVRIEEGRDFSPSGDLAAYDAEREARAILAETEAPSGASYYVRDARDLRASKCLADALRAFVGEPCRCAGGMHWSPERGYYHCNGITA